MNKKKILYIALAVVLIGVLFLLLLKTLPKTAAYFPIFLVLIVLDLYLWNSFKNKLLKIKRWIRNIINVLYWLPFVLFTLLTIISLFVPRSTLFSGYVVYIVGFVFTMYVAKLIPAVLLLLADLIRFSRCMINRLKAKTEKERTDKLITRSRFLEMLGLISGGLVMSGFITGMIKWATEFKIWHHNIKLNKISDDFLGLRIVHISDIHLGSWTSDESFKEAISMINQQDPDLVFFTGDMVNYSTGEMSPFLDNLKEIRSKYGIYAVLGNHDYGEYSSWDSLEEKEKNMTDLYGYYKDLGWKLLRNESEVIEIDGQNIGIIGVENWSIYKRFPIKGDLLKATNGLDNTDVQLLLTHDPTHWESKVINDFKDIDFTFAGHTHGLQFGVELKGFKWSPAKFLYKQWAGIYEHTNALGNVQYINVNRGLGTIGYPGRIGIMPEITVIDLA